MSGGNVGAASDARPSGGVCGVVARLRTMPNLALVCVVLALVPVVAVCVAQPPVYAMLIDECVQELYARGDFLAAPSGMLMPYSLAPVSVPLSLLYGALPQVPWYALTLFLLTVISFAVAFDLTARSRTSDPVCLILALVLLAAEVITLFYFTYTIVSFLTVSAGLMLLVGRASFGRPGGPRVSDAGALLLIFFGYALRPESGQAAFVIFSPFAVWVLVRNRNVGSIMRGALAVACVVLATLIGQVAYDATPGWEGFSAYLDAGRSALDYPDLDVDQIREILPELSANDAEMLNDWMFVDEGTYPTSLFERYSSERPHYSLGYLVSSLSAKTTYAMLAFVAALGVVAWLLTLDVGARGSERALALGIVGVLLLSCLLLIMRERVRLHVAIPLAISTLMALVVCAYAPGSAARAGHLSSRDRGLLAGRARAVVPVLVGALCVVGCAGMWWVQVRPEQAKTAAPTTLATRAYIEAHPNQLIVMNRSQSVLYYGAGNIFELAGWEYPANVLTIGGWERETAPWKEFLERWDLSPEHTLADLVDRDDAVMIVQDYDLPQVERYLTEHTGETVRAETVEDLGPSLRATDRRILAVRFVSK